MKTIIKKKFAISAICFVMMAMLFAIFCNPFTSAAFAQSQDNSKNVVAEMSAFNDVAKNQRLYNLTLSHIVANMDSKASISATKQIRDFDGNAYTLFELSPIGYAIYHIQSGKYVEYAEASYSPYSGYGSDLYYGGGMQYYYLKEGMLKHTLKSELSIPASSIQEMSDDSRKMADAFCNNISSDNINYINGNTKSANISTINGAVAQKEMSQISLASARIGMTTFFPALNTTTKMGYRSGGACGYIATNLMIGYNYFAFDYGLINNSSFVDFPNKTMNGPGLTNRLLQLGGEDPNGSGFAMTNSYDMFLVIQAYLNEVNNTQPWSYNWYYLNTNIKSTLDAGYPVVFFGNLKKPDGTSGKINHAVVAYDYANYGFLNASRKYRVHYGWSGYASVWLESPSISSNCYMKIG